jgi:uncharacterized protein
MKEVVLITGANGVIAKRFSELFDDTYALKFLTRRKKKNEFEWNIENGVIEKDAFKNVDHIIHLAGAGIADKRWSDIRKKVIELSRINSADLILNSLKKSKIKITSFISASAIGYYGTETTDAIYTETDEKGYGFLSDICDKWEKIADKFTTNTISSRTLKIRFGIVLSKKGGALKKMTTPVKLYIGSPLGTGKQYMPWIHVDDLCMILKYLIENKKMTGIYNAVSPEHKTNKEFTKAIAQTISKPILFPNIPKFVIKWIFGEVSSILLKGSRVSSLKIVKAGYRFTFPNLEIALKDLLK